VQNWDVLGVALSTVLGVIVSSLAAVLGSWRNRSSEARSGGLEAVVIDSVEEIRRLQQDNAAAPNKSKARDDDLGKRLAALERDVKAAAKERSGAPEKPAPWRNLLVPGLFMILSPGVAAVATFYFTHNTYPDCADARQKVVAIVEKHPTAWVPLPETDNMERYCTLNQVAVRVAAEHG